MSEQECQILVTVTIYDGTPDEAIQALLDYNGFDLPAGGEAEITAAVLAPAP